MKLTNSLKKNGKDVYLKIKDFLNQYKVFSFLNSEFGTSLTRVITFINIFYCVGNANY